MSDHGLPRYIHSHHPNPLQRFCAVVRAQGFLLTRDVCRKLRIPETQYHRLEAAGVFTQPRRWGRLPRPRIGCGSLRQKTFSGYGAHCAKGFVVRGRHFELRRASHGYHEVRDGTMCEMRDHNPVVSARRPERSHLSEFCWMRSVASTGQGPARSYECPRSQLLSRDIIAIRATRMAAE